MAWITCPVCNREYGSGSDHCTRCEKDMRDDMDKRASEYIPLLKAAIFFCYTVRHGFVKRERKYFHDFITPRVDLSPYSFEEVDLWLHKLRCGDVWAYNRDGVIDEYESILAAVPAEHLAFGRELAFKIARGSGRKKIDPEIMDRINREFSKK